VPQKIKRGFFSTQFLAVSEQIKNYYYGLLNLVSHQEAYFTTSLNVNFVDQLFYESSQEFFDANDLYGKEAVVVEDII
jgi:hypothetical protein